jgi:hypothetical protein
MFVGLELHGPLAGGNGDRDDLLTEAALFHCANGPLLAFQCQRILLFTADAIALGDIFRGHAHVELAPGVMQQGIHVVDRLAVAEARTPAQVRQDERTAAHILCAATNGYVGIAQQDRLRRRNYGLQTRAAQAVDVEGRGFQRNTGTTAATRAR